MQASQISEALKARNTRSTRVTNNPKPKTRHQGRERVRLGSLFRKKPEHHEGLGPTAEKNVPQQIKEDTVCAPTWTVGGAIKNFAATNCKTRSTN
jgi:hypothetical protein